MESVSYVFISDLYGDGVSSIGSLALLPPHKTTIHTSRSTARSLASNSGELAGVLLLSVVKLGKCGHKASQTSSGRSQTSTSGEGVHGGNSDTILRPILLLDNNFTSGTVDLILCQLSDFLEASLTTAVDLDLRAVEPHAIACVVLTSSNGGDCVQITL